MSYVIIRDFAHLLRRSTGCYSSRSGGLPVSLIPWVTPILPINVGLHPVHLQRNQHPQNQSLSPNEERKGRRG